MNGMFIQIRREIALPVWAVAVGVAAFNAPPAAIPSLVALLGLTVAGSAALALVEWLRTSRPLRIEVLPALDLERAADLHRMDSDKG
jgi:hypothetical protein